MSFKVNALLCCKKEEVYLVFAVTLKGSGQGQSRVAPSDSNQCVAWISVADR